MAVNSCGSSYGKPFGNVVQSHNGIDVSLAADAQHMLFSIITMGRVGSTTKYF